MIKTCYICHKEFKLKSSQHHRRTICYDPNCIKEHKEIQYKKMMIKSQKVHEKIKNGETRRTYKRRDPVDNRPWPYKCNTCGKKLKHPYRFNCPTCRNRLSDLNVIGDPSEIYGGLSY